MGENLVKSIGDKIAPYTLTLTTPDDLPKGTRIQVMWDRRGGAVVAVYLYMPDGTTTKIPVTNQGPAS